MTGEAIGMNWQPIETAPKDGTDVLLFFPHMKKCGVWIGHFVDAEDFEYGKRVSKRQYWSINTFSFNSSPVPSHWMPIPPEPERASA